MPKVAPLTLDSRLGQLDAAIRTSDSKRKTGKVWQELGPQSWRNAALAVQASSASYGSPYDVTDTDTMPPEQGIRVKKIVLDASSPFPGDDANREWADLWAEIEQGVCKHSCFIEEVSTDTQVWVLALQMSDETCRLYCSFRGTKGKQDARTDANFSTLKGSEELCGCAGGTEVVKGWKKHLNPTEFNEINACAFHEGFFKQYSAAAAGVKEELEKGAKELEGKYELIICGHSMGGALANICSFDLLACGFTTPESMQLITIGSGPMGNTSLANLHDKLSKVDEDARRHLRIVNNNDPVPAAALGVGHGGTLSCVMMCVNGETFEHSGTIIWMGRSTGQFRTKSLGILGGLKQAGIRLCSPCAACCLSGSKVSVLDHLTVPYIEKLASFIFDKYETPMRCLGSNTTVATGGIVKARVWTGVGSAGFIFPEQRLSEAEGGVKLLQEKKDFGICLSGGGFRATTLALGWIRILHTEGILKQARYLSSNSGGSWFNTAFSYQEIYPLELFLGDYIAPMDLTPEAADRQGRKEGCYATAIAESNFMSDFVINLVKDWFDLDFFREKDKNKVRAWSEAVGKGFLDKFQVGTFNSAYCLSGREEHTQKETAAPIINVACSKPGMPFPIMVGCIAAKGDHRQFHCYEFTPLYSGCPAKIEDAPGMKFGGVLIEPFAANSKPPTKPLPPMGPPVTMELEVEWRVPLVQAAGVSSSYIAQMKADSSKEGMWEALGCPELYIWNGIDGQGGETPFADGGGVDNAAIHALLRRGNTKILCCYANSVVWAVEAPLDAAAFWDLSALFGAVPAGKGPKMASGIIEAAAFNKHVQVFETHKWQDLVSAVSNCVEKRASVVVSMKLKVLENEAQGVQGGFYTDVVFVFNSMPEAWHAALPEETRTALKESKELKNFPSIPTTKLNYDPDLASYLSQIASYNMLQALPAINNLLSSCSVEKDTAESFEGVNVNRD